MRKFKKFKTQNDSLLFAHRKTKSSASAVLSVAVIQK